MRALLPFNVCILVAAVGLFFLHGHPMQGPVLISSLAVLGLLFIVRRDSFARESVRQHNTFWGFALDERAVRITRVLAVVVGLCFIALAAVSFTQATRSLP
jgi:low temperature requirement protein LtrA